MQSPCAQISIQQAAAAGKGRLVQGPTWALAAAAAWKSCSQMSHCLVAQMAVVLHQAAICMLAVSVCTAAEAVAAIALTPAAAGAVAAAAGAMAEAAYLSLHTKAGAGCAFKPRPPAALSYPMMTPQMTVVMGMTAKAHPRPRMCAI